MFVELDGPVLMEFYGGLTFADFRRLTIADHRALVLHRRKVIEAIQKSTPKR